MDNAWEIAKSIAIQADRQSVWNVLVDPTYVRLWLSDTDLEFSATWQVGGEIQSTGNWHGLAIENKGRILDFEPEKRLAYTHWSSLSQFPDTTDHYTTIRLELTDAEDGLALSVRQENFRTFENYAHWNFYWNMALARIKRLAESGAPINPLA